MPNHISGSHRASRIVNSLTQFSRRPGKATVALVAVGMLATITSAASIPSMVADVTAGQQMVVNGDAAAGLSHWSVKAPGQIRLVSPGQSDNSALRLTTGRTDTVALNDQPNSVGAASQGSRYRVSAWVRTATPNVTTQLRIREVQGTALVSTEGPHVWLADSAWHLLSFDYQVKRQGSSLDLNVVAWQLKPGQSLDIDTVSMVTQGTGSATATPTTSPTATAAPTVTKTATASPTATAIPSTTTATPSPAGTATSAPKPPVTASPAGTCLLNAKLVPSCGALWGVYTKPTGSEGWAQPVTSLEQSTGRTFDIVKRYHDWSNTGGNGQFPDKYEQALGANGQRLLDFSWVSNIYSTGGHVMWADIAAGKYDSSVILPEAARLKAWAQPVFMDFDHEMDGKTRTANGTTADYVAAYRHIHDVMAKASVTNVVWVWTPTGSMGNITRIAAMYPGDAYVDWIGYDPYNFYTCHSTSWQAPDVTFNRFYSWLMNNGHGNKPFMLGEYGSVATTTATGAWYGGVVPALKGLPNIKAVMEWNSGTSTSCDFRVMTQPTILTGFAQAGLDPYVNVRR